MALLVKFNRKKESGFTLIELLIVLGIMALMFAISVPVFLNLYQERDLNSQTRDLVANIEEMRDKSMTDGYDFGLYFENDSFTTFRGSSYDQSDQVYRFEISDNLNFSQINLVDNQFIFQSPTGEVLDYEDDSSSVVISNQAGESRELIVNRLGVVDVD